MIMERQKFNNPFALVASVLNCKPGDLTLASGWGHHPPEWDSYGQALILEAIEEEYEVEIEDQEVNNFKTMELIVKFHEYRLTK